MNYQALLLISLITTACGVKFKDEVIIERENVLLTQKLLEKAQKITIKADTVTLENELITTNGKTLIIEAGRLYSFGNSVIESFREGTSNKFSIFALQPGEIKITANEAHGRLKVLLRGHDGKDGVTPPALGENGRGHKGADGDSGFQQCHPHTVGGDCWCSGSKVAQPGGAGKKGLPGEPGAHASDTPPLTLSIEDSKNFYFEYKVLPGKPGKGSLGGQGGPGGLGGRASRAGICSVPGAPNGPQGPSGDSAPDGLPGQIQPICIKLNKNQKMECL